MSVCPYCHSNEWAPAEVSGRAVIAGFTINEHTWLPTFPPPYVIAIVAIEEDDRVRLTTNIVGCEPGDVYVGMKVQVRFEHDDDVWIPLFEPTGETDKGPFPTVDETSRVARPMPKGAKKFEDEVAITGIGMSQVGRRLMVDPITLTVAAAKQAIADAGLEPSDIACFAAATVSVIGSTRERQPTCDMPMPVMATSSSNFFRALRHQPRDSTDVSSTVGKGPLSVSPVGSNRGIHTSSSCSKAGLHLCMPTRRRAQRPV